MTNNEGEYWEKLQDYAEGKLSPDEQRQVGKWVAESEEAQTIVSGFKQIQKTIPDDVARDRYFQRQIDQTSDRIGKKAQSLLQRLLVAASVLIIGGIATYLFFNQSRREASYERLLADYTNEYYSAPFTTRNVEEKTTDWVLAYQNKDFVAVINHLENTNRNLPRETFYLGMAYFYMSDYQQAGTYLLDKTLENSLFIEQGKWYAALAYLQLNKQEQALELLKEIVETKTYRHREAGQLINELEGINEP